MWSAVFILTPGVSTWLKRRQERLKRLGDQNQSYLAIDGDSVHAPPHLTPHLQPIGPSDPAK